MEAVKPSLKEEKPLPPSIAVGYLRNDDGVIDRIELKELKPGMVVKRCGKYYEVDAKGTQKRIA